MPRNSIATGLVDYVLPVAEMPARLVAYRDSISLTAGDATATRTRRRPSTGAAATRSRRCATSSRSCACAPGTTSRTTSAARVLPPHRAAHRRHAGGRPAGLRELHPREPAGGARAPQRPAHQRHQLLPRPRRRSRRWSGWSSRACSRTKERATRCASGCRAAPRARRRTRSRCCSPSTPRRSPPPPSIQVFATDIDADAIADGARRLLHSERRGRRAAPSGCAASSRRTATATSVRRELREMVLFAHHNLLKDPPFSHLDLSAAATCSSTSTARSAGEGDVHLPLRPEPRRLPLPRLLRVGRRPLRPLRHGGQGEPHLPGERWPCRARSRTCSPPPRPGTRAWRRRRPARRGRRRARTSASPTSTCTGACWSSTGRRRWSSTPSTRSSTSPSRPAATCRSPAASPRTTC